MAFSPSLKAIQGASLNPNEGNLIPIYKEVSTQDSPTDVYLKVRRGEHSFLLESTGDQRQKLHSIIGTEPFKVVQTGKKHSIKGDPLKYLEDELQKYKVCKKFQQTPSILNGGAVGYISYDCIQHFEAKIGQHYPLKTTIEIPESLFMFSSSFIAFDHQKPNWIKIVALCSLDGDLEANYNLAVKRIEELENRLSSKSIPFADSNPTRHEGISNIGRDGYKKHVTILKQHIVDGDIIQAVPSQRVSREIGVHPFNIYQQLRSLNPSNYMFFMELDDFYVVGASPELLVKVTERKVITHPIAGTRKRGKSEKEDKELAEDLLNDEKEKAEHIMLVDLGRNDVNRVADPTTTSVDSFMKVERYSHVMHIVSEISGMLREECSQFDAFRSIFPAGTLSGAPKIKATELIAELEGNDRGIYGGAVGYFSFNEDVDACIAIRTLVVKNNIAYLQAGGGIVFDSDPELEYQETVNKMAALSRAIDMAEECFVSQEKGTLELRAPGASPTSKIFNSKFLCLSSLPREVQSTTKRQKADRRITLLIDNYDSFTWNLYQYLCQLGENVVVHRNDAISIEECISINPTRIIISPGPGTPEKDSGISKEVINYFQGKVPILGVCMGHECICEFYGGKIVHCGEIVHGKTSKIIFSPTAIYKGIENRIEVIRYHSLALDEKTLPETLEITSRTENGVVMGVRHKEFKIEGVQFHPESIASEEGRTMLRNFLGWTGGK